MAKTLSAILLDLALLSVSLLIIQSTFILMIFYNPLALHSKKVSGEWNAYMCTAFSTKEVE